MLLKARVQQLGFACGPNALVQHSRRKLGTAVKACNAQGLWCHRIKEPEQRSVLHSELPAGHLFLEDRDQICSLLDDLATPQGVSKTSHMAPGAGQPRHSGCSPALGRLPDTPPKCSPDTPLPHTHTAGDGWCGGEPPFDFRLVAGLTGPIRGTFHLGQDRWAHAAHAAGDTAHTRSHPR